MTKYRVFLVSQILFIGTSLAVPTNVEETSASTVASTPVSSAAPSSSAPSSSALPEGISESTIAAAAEILQRAAEAISIGNGTIPAEEGDGIPDDGWEYENTTYVDTRRIMYSKTVEKGKRPYMVYLQLTKESAKAHKYRGWLCGGVIVDKYYVLTSAACVEDADRFYIVSGTTKFVDSFDFKNNDCICKHRRRVVWKCIPKNYKFDFQDSIKWSSNDIAIVKVDRPFKLGVTEKGCEFAADLICINNVSRELEKPGTKGFIAGWGSGSNFREGVYRRQRQEVHIPQNAKCLQEAKVCVMDNEQCAKRWAQRFRNIITQYMICTKDVMKRLSDLCEKKYANCTDVDTGKSRRSAEQFEEPNNEVATIWNVDLGRHLRDPDDYTARRASNHGGFCENDHGGPLIVKYQNKERVIGVISACKIDPKSHSCHGPFLYTSVFRNRQFISCAINKDTLENCRRVFRTGITHEEWEVSWDGFKEEDEINMKADSYKDENEFNSDEIAAGKPYLRQNDEVVLDKFVEHQDAGNIKIVDDSSSEEIQTNKPVKTKEVNEENVEDKEETVKKTVKIKEVKEENEEVKKKTQKKPVETKEVIGDKEEDDEEDEEKKLVKTADAIKETEEEEVETETNSVKTKKGEENIVEEEENEKKPVKTIDTTDETEDEEDKIEKRPDKIKENKEEDNETENKPIKSIEPKEEIIKKEEANEKNQTKKTKKDRKRKHKKNKRNSKRKVKKVKKSQEVETESKDETEAEAMTEAKELPVTEAVLEVIEKTTVADEKNEDAAAKVGGDPDKAEVFYESSRDDNVNDPIEE